jgi:hypothetical protein
MEKKNKSLSIVYILLIVLLVTIIGTTLFITTRIGGIITSTFDPMQVANQALSTQVSKLLNPKPTVIPDPVTIIREVQSLARLETIQYTVEKIITAEVNQGVFGPLFGDRLLFVAHGVSIAGVDLSKLESEDLRMEDSTLYMAIPDAEVFVTTLNNDESYVYDRTTGLLRKGDPQLETEARQLAEQEILNAALEDGILAQAQINAEIFLERLLNDLGYSYVVFE